MSTEPNRQQAKSVISQKGQNDPELAQAYAEAHKRHSELAQIKNKHELDVRKAERGWIGCIFGNWKNVPMFIALLSVVFGIYVFYDFMKEAATEGADKNFWSESAKLSLAFASGALGYIFGRGSNVE